MNQDVELGYGILLILKFKWTMKQAEVYPVGYQDQLTMDEYRGIIPSNSIELEKF